MSVRRTATAEDYISCPNCGEQNEAWSAYCQTCGIQIEMSQTDKFATKPKLKFEPERPGCVTALAVVLAITGLVSLVALLLQFIPIFTTNRINLSNVQIMVISLAAAGICLWLAGGLWQQRRSARSAVILINIAAILAALINIVVPFFTPAAGIAPAAQAVGQAILQWILSGILIYWFTRNRHYFYRR